VFFRDEGEGSAMLGKVAAELRIRAQRARKATKSFTSAPGGTGGWFELHQLKKAVPQKFHNAASCRVASRQGVGEERVGMRDARRVKCPSFRRFSAFPRRGKALLFAPRSVAQPITTEPATT